MTTALSRAQELLDLIVAEAAAQGVSLPTPQWVQIGDSVIQCPGVSVSAGGLTPPALSEERCVPPMQTTLIATIAREWVCVNDDGTDNPSAIEAGSVLVQPDADVLWQAAYSMTPYLGPEGGSLSWLIEGGLIYTQMQIVVGVGI